MTNPDNVGGLLSKLIAAANYIDTLGGDSKPYRAYGELCRAAPAGGEPVVVRDIEAERKLASRGTPGIDRLWDTQWVNIVNHDACYFGYTVEEAVNTAVKLTEQKMAENFKAAAQDSAPAGSGEVEKLVRSARAIIDHAVHGEPVSLQDAHDKLTEAAALLRKLSPAGSGEVEEDIEALSQSLELMAQHRDEAGWNCDAECLRTAAALLRKLQQGADYVMVPRVPTRAMLDAGHDDLVRDGEIDPMLKYVWRQMVAASQDREDSDARD